MKEKHIPKAYSCVDRYEPSNTTIVFAETPGKAKSIAKLSDCFEDTEWNDIYVRRVPELDLLIATCNDSEGVDMTATFWRECYDKVRCEEADAV